MIMKLEGSIDCVQGAVRAVRYNVDGDYILTCGSNKTVKLWNAKTRVSILFFFKYINFSFFIISKKNLIEKYFS